MLYLFVPSDLDLQPLDLKFAPLVTLVQRYVSTNLEVSTAFLFQENLMHGMLLPALGTAYRRVSRQRRHCRLSSDI